MIVTYLSGLNIQAMTIRINQPKADSWVCAPTSEGFTPKCATPPGSLKQIYIYIYILICNKSKKTQPEIKDLQVENLYIMVSSFIFKRARLLTFASTQLRLWPTGTSGLVTAYLPSGCMVFEGTLASRALFGGPNPLKNTNFGHTTRVGCHFGPST